MWQAIKMKKRCFVRDQKKASPQNRKLRQMRGINSLGAFGSISTGSFDGPIDWIVRYIFERHKCWRTKRFMMLFMVPSSETLESVKMIIA